MKTQFGEYFQLWFYSGGIFKVFLITLKYIYIKFFTQSFHRQKIVYSVNEKEIQ